MAVEPGRFGLLATAIDLHIEREPDDIYFKVAFFGHSAENCKCAFSAAKTGKHLQLTRAHTVLMVGFTE